MLEGLVTMSAEEIDRLSVIRRVQEGTLKQVKAAELLGLTTRQVRRLEASYERSGASGLVSRHRGHRGNRATPEIVTSAGRALQAQDVA